MLLRWQESPGCVVRPFYLRALGRFAHHRADEPGLVEANLDGKSVPLQPLEIRCESGSNAFDGVVEVVEVVAVTLRRGGDVHRRTAGQVAVGAAVDREQLRDFFLKWC